MLRSALGLLRQRGHYLPLLVVLVISFVLNIIGIRWGLPNYLDWAIDSIAPYDVLEAAYNRFSNGWYHIYPPFHHTILAIFYAPLMGYLTLSGGLKSPSVVFPFGLADPVSTFTHLILISRLVSVLMGVGIILVVYLVVRELFDRRSALFAALIVALYYHLVYYAHSANVDVPYIFWALLAIYAFVRVLKYAALKDYVLFAMFSILAISTKDQAYGLFLLSPLSILWMRFTEVSETTRRRPALVGMIFDRRHIIALGVAVATLVVAHNVIFNFSGFINHVRLIMGGGSVGGIDWQEHRLFPPTVLGQLQLFWKTVSFLAFGLTPPIFVLCLIGCFYCVLRHPRYSLPILFLPASYYLIFIVPILQVRARYVIPIGIIMAFFGGKVLADIWNNGKWKGVSRAAISLAFVYEAIFAIHVDLLFIRDSRYAAEEWMHGQFRKGTVVETFTPHRLLKYYPRFPSWVKVRTSNLKAGVRWEPMVEMRLPKLYVGREDPDYIVLSDLWIERFLNRDSDQARLLRHLFEGRMGYTLAASFKTQTLVDDLPMNPRIFIFKNTTKSAFSDVRSMPRE